MGGGQLDMFYKADFVWFGSVIVEIKALSQLTGKEEAQVINFGTSRLQHKRLVHNL
jgi:hypothetical protein